MEQRPLTAKHKEARESLPPELRSAFDDLVEDYRHFSMVRLGRSYLSFAIIADLVRQGWRYSGPRQAREAEGNRVGPRTA